MLIEDPISLKARLLKFVVVDIKTSCWEWQGAKRGYGYGYMTIGTVKNNSVRKEQAHRIAYVLFNNKTIAEGNVISHSCDNPGCVNPEHLSSVTQEHNMKDMLAKGRADTSGLYDFSKKGKNYAR